MNYRRLPALFLAAVCMLPALPAAGAQVESGGIYCFGSGDFSQETLTGICITALPESETGSVMLGERTIRPGDVLSAGQLEQLGLKVFHGPAQAGTVSFVPEGDCEDLAEALAKRGIAVRAGLHCAPLAHESAGTVQTGTVRVSFGWDARDLQADWLTRQIRACLQS